MITLEEWKEKAVEGESRFYYLGYDDVEAYTIRDNYSYVFSACSKEGGKCHASILRTTSGVYPSVSCDWYSAQNCFFSISEAKKALEEKQKKRKIQAVKDAERRLEIAKKALEEG